MAQHYIKQLIFSWLRMVHREIILLFLIYSKYQEMDYYVKR